MANSVKKTVALVLGGVRSGKSRWAQDFAARGQAVGFIATAEALDEEMHSRIQRHRADRPANWTTVETPIDLPGAISDCGSHCDMLLVDCLTVWTANLLTAEQGDREKILAHGNRLCDELRRTRASVVLVSNEVGSGIVPVDEMTRLYRDLLGELNQRVAAVADEVVLLVAGCPLRVKPAAGGLR